jgi:flagellar biosynthesis GTPase FlhF
MELKRIVAKDLRAAAERAVLEHGKDALFISTVEADGMTELIIAIDSIGPAEADEFAADPAGDREVESPGGPVAMDAPSRENEIVKAVKSEIAQLRQEMLWTGRLPVDSPALESRPEIRAVMSALLDEGVPARLQARLAPALAQAQTASEAFASLGDHLGRLLEPMFCPSTDEDWSGIHVLYGPPGAGKTMMCARLVALASSRLGADHVAWISYQDNRLGAWSQTQALAAQCGVEAFRARDPEALSILLEELSDRGAVFVDTAHSNGRQLAADLATFLVVGTDAQLHAVVAADASVQALRRLSNTAEGSNMLVTRLDLAERPWPLIDHLLGGRPWQVRAVSGTPWVSSGETSLSANTRKLIEDTLTPLLENRREASMPAVGSEGSGARHG